MQVWLNSFSFKQKTSYVRIVLVRQPHYRKQGGSPMKDNNSLSHTTWNCKYHIVFAPKYRRQVIYGQLRVDIGKILRMLCDRKGIVIHEAECCKDHVHMLVSIPPKYKVSDIVGYLKGKSSLMIFDRHANLKYKYGNRHFWCRGYFVDTVGKNTKKIEEYIKTQLQEDIAEDQISIQEYIDPFTGEKVKIKKK
jgi:putative transposase